MNSEWTVQLKGNLHPTGLSHVPLDHLNLIIFLSIPGGNLFTYDLKVLFWQDFNIHVLYTVSEDYNLVLIYVEIYFISLKLY